MALLKIGALWKKEGRNGNPGHLGGTIKEEVVLPTGAKVFAFKVKEKTNENSPDFELCLAVEDDQAPQDQGRTNGGQFDRKGQGQGNQGQQGGQRQGQGGTQGRNHNQGGNANNGQRQQGRQQDPPPSNDDVDFDF